MKRGMLIALIIAGVAIIIFLIIAGFITLNNSMSEPHKTQYNKDNALQDNEDITEEDLQDLPPPLPSNGESTTCIDLGCAANDVFVGSINSDKYYTCDCHYGERILPENIICFTSDEDATSQEYVKVVDC